MGKKRKQQQSEVNVTNKNLGIVRSIDIIYLRCGKMETVSSCTSKVVNTNMKGEVSLYKKKVADMILI